MRNSTYLKRLERDLPVWVEKGWVQPGAEQDLLSHVAAQQGGGERHIIALAIMGVLLLGAGVITFFAANWSGMSKLSKLLVLFGSMSAAYIAAAITVSRAKLPRVGESLWLLGVLLFGANIMLIAQTYNIDSHYPDGVLTWALGGLLVAYAAPAQAAMAAAIALAVLWSGMESLEFDQLHWGFLVFWLACLPAVYRKSWHTAAQLAMAGLLLWSLFFFTNLGRIYGHSAYLVQLYFLVYLMLFVGGMVLTISERTRELASIVKHYAAVAATLAFFALTFPELHRRSVPWRGIAATPMPDASWAALTLSAAVLLVALVLWYRRLNPSAEASPYLKWGRMLLAVIAVLFVANLILQGEYGGLLALLFNVAFFGALVWLLFHSLHHADKTMLNLTFLMFAVWLLTRYFDTFWTLLNRSFFFMAGGVLLLAGGYVLERQRRKLGQMMAAREGGKLA
ncbi:MAG TPA: DUF2157 domain-containing protein [Gallionella sp.]|nr:DUF2157 domain-containing protein [Gallionella sp.]